MKKTQRKKLFNALVHKRKIRNRVGLIILFVTLTIFLLTFNFYQQGLQSWGGIDSNLKIFFLINLNVFLLITVILLTFRNLIKLIYERKRKIMGFRLKYKLTVAFVLISSLPMLLLFFIVNGFLQNTLDFWFQGQYSIVVKNSLTTINNLNQQQDEELRHFSETVFWDTMKRHHIQIQALPQNNLPIQVPSEKEGDLFSKKEMKQWFLSEIERYKLSGIAIYSLNNGLLHHWISPENDAKNWQSIAKDELTKYKDQHIFNLSHKTDNSLISRGVIRFSTKDDLYFLEVNRVLAGKSYMDLNLVLNDLKEHNSFLSLEKQIKSNYTNYLLLFILLIIFGGTWFGYYLARSIVTPIETLVDGTRRISKGDLDFQIELKTDDEISMLLESFNIMTKELLHNRKKLAQSQGDLLSINQKLEERSIFVELVLQNIQSGIFSVDNAGYIKAINPYMVRLFQTRADKLLSRHYRTVFSKEQIALFEELHQKLAGSENTSVQKDAHIIINKKVTHVSFELFQLRNPEGLPLGKLLVVDDLSELDRSTRARAWREVARRIAHEIKNPLTPIQLSTQRIRRKYLENLEEPEMLDSCTATIITEVNGLKNMVNEFSKFARLPEINASPGNVNKLLKSVCNFFKEGLPQAVSLSFESDDNIPSSLIDVEQMRRVFTNLIDNAVAAMPNGGGITLKSSYAKDLKMIIIKLEDNGSGIPDNIIDQVFEPYVTTKKDGTGLGLAIAHQIISDHNGYIRVENIEPHGTRFSIELPA